MKMQCVVYEEKTVFWRKKEKRTMYDMMYKITGDRKKENYTRPRAVSRSRRNESSPGNRLEGTINEELSDLVS